MLGGLLPGEVVEITGTKMSGKTLLALHIVLDHLLHHPDASAFWIDPDSSFRSDRAFEILSYIGHLDAHSVLARLSVTFCPTASSVVLATDQLRRSIESGGTRQPRFIVIDTITAIFSPLINGTTSQATPTHLRTIPHKFPSRAFNLGLLLTRSLTPTFGYMADTTLALSRTDSIAGADDNSDDAWGWRPENIQAEKEGKKIHVAQILRSRRMASGKWCTFAVRDGVTLEEFRIPELSGSGSGSGFESGFGPGTSGSPSFTAEAKASTSAKGKNRAPPNAFGSHS
ncbi:hypothetical protein BS47DRAFT_1072500 [Hydnum rufescens UP504]|uniref:RecA family profile 1 domain-containing protein n=1 Tax=Hydnum rufescens UP504 TaxID=1448309 RepID=A0A9P6DYL5_9AGAM|nr:hypothetical protein BS47DRAFT_1072500 [Hydnum rufescens UP504]